MNNITHIVKHLIIVNVIIFLAAQTLPAFIPELSLFFPKSDHFQPYQLITHMFMHGSLGHLAFNMLSLFFLGQDVERNLGPQKFFGFYLLSGFGAMAVHMLVDYFSFQSLLGIVEPDSINQITTEGRQLLLSGRNYVDGSLSKLNEVLNVPVVGASGAIYGVFFAYAYLFPNRELYLMFIPIPIKARYLVLGLLAYDLFFGVTNLKTGIAHFAHIGGGLTGLLLMILFFGDKSNKRR